MSSQIPFLTFHAIDDGPLPIAITPRSFETGLKTLVDNGYTTITVREAAQYLVHKLSFPERAIVLAFDDGYASVYETALPLFERYKLTGTVFVTVNSGHRVTVDEPFAAMNGRKMLSWRQVRELSEKGVEIGAHTLTHPDLTQLTHRQAQNEIVAGKQMLEDRLGVPVTSFAYPFGRYNRNAYEIVRKNFACACTDRLQLVSRDSDVHLLGRVDAFYLRNAAWLNLLPLGFFPWYVRARAVPRNLRRSFVALTAL